MMERIDAAVEHADERLREKYGINPTLALAIDALSVMGGIYLIASYGVLLQLVGVLAVLGGLLGIISKGRGDA